MKKAKLAKTYDVLQVYLSFGNIIIFQNFKAGARVLHSCTVTVGTYHMTKIGRKRECT